MVAAISRAKAMARSFRSSSTHPRLRLRLSAAKPKDVTIITATLRRTSFWRTPRRMTVQIYQASQLSATRRAHPRRCRPRSRGQRTGSTPPARPSRAVLRLDPSRRAKLAGCREQAGDAGITMSPGGHRCPQCVGAALGHTATDLGGPLTLGAELSPPGPEPTRHEVQRV